MISQEGNFVPGVSPPVILSRTLALLLEILSNFRFTSYTWLELVYLGKNEVLIS